MTNMKKVFSAFAAAAVTGFGSILYAQEMTAKEYRLDRHLEKRPTVYQPGTVVLSNRFGRVEVSLYAAQVLSYVPAGKADVFYMPPDRDFSQNRQLHGGVPVCWPWFNLLGEPLSTQHGFARHSMWRVVENYTDDDLSRVVLSLESSPETKRFWPFDFSLTYTITLTDRLTMDLVTKNTADPQTAAGKWFELTEGFHPYFRVSDPRRAFVDGVLDGETCVTVQGRFHLDGVYPAGSGEWLLRDEGTKRAVAIAARGAKDLILWNPGDDELKPRDNRTKGDEMDFLCVEPATLRYRGAIRLEPGQTHRLQMTVKDVTK